MIQSREIRLKSRPDGLPAAANFELVTVDLPAPAPGQVLVRNLYMSVDPYMRPRMVDRKSYVPPFQLNEAMTGGAVGVVVASNDGSFAVGDHVLSMQGWREAFLADGRGLTPVDPALAPVQSYLGIMGMPGMTAYFGLLDIGAPHAGETVFVSAAAGAVGSVACQIAKLQGCRVVGSAGSDEKVAWLKEVIGVDAAFNYKRVPVAAGLAKHCPDGVDIYFDNVGGGHLEAALQRMNNHGRVVACGMISQYNATEPTPAPRNLGLIIGKRIKIQGYIVSDYTDRAGEFYADMSTWLAGGKIVNQETIVHGIEQAPAAFIGLFTGENVGKMLVKVG